MGTGSPSVPPAPKPGRPRRRRLWGVLLLLALLGVGGLMWALSSPFRILGRHPKPVRALAFSPDGAGLFSADWQTQGSEAGINWDLATGRPRGRFPGGPLATLSADAGLAAVVDRDARTIGVWETGRGARRLAVPESAGYKAQRLCFSPDAARLAVASEPSEFPTDRPGRLEVVGLATGERVWARETDDKTVGGLAFSPDGRRLVESRLDRDAAVRLWAAATGVNQGALPLPIAGPAVAFSPDGRLLAVGGSPVTVYDLEAGAVAATLPRTGYSPASAVAFSPDGKRLAVGGNYTDALQFFKGCQVSVWDAGTWQKRAEGRGRRLGKADLVYCLAFSPDGRRVAFGSAAGEVGVWEVPAVP